MLNSTSFSNRTGKYFAITFGKQQEPGAVQFIPFVVTMLFTFLLHFFVAIPQISWNIFFLLFQASFYFLNLLRRHGTKIGVMAKAPTYRKMLQHAATKTDKHMSGMATHTDNHHVVGAVSCVLQVGTRDSRNGLYTCKDLGMGKRTCCKEIVGASFCVPKGVCHGVRKALRGKNRVVLAVGW